MQSIKLSITRQELISALRLLGVVRRRRFRSTLPVWLRFIAEAGELQIVEDRGAVEARVPASGDWPCAGATVDLFLLRRAVEDCPAPAVDLHATADAVMVFGGKWHVRLALQEFGPASRVGKPPATPSSPPGPEGLPLFHWAVQYPLPRPRSS